MQTLTQTAGQPDALHGAVGAAAALAVGARGRDHRGGPVHGLHRRRPTTSRATPPRSCTCTCRRHGCRCSATRWWRHRASASWCSAIRWRTSPPRRRRPSARVFTFLCLVTGSLWGKPMWGAFWAWDPRLTSVLILFFLYLGLIALRSSIEDESLAGQPHGDPRHRRHRHPARHPLLGELEQHPPAAERVAPGRCRRSTLDLLWPLLVMAVGMTVLFAAMHLKAMRNEILRRRVKALRLAEVQIGRRLGAAGGGVSAMDLGPHAAFIWASYAIVAVGVAICIALAVVRRPAPAAPDRRVGGARRAPALRASGRCEAEACRTLRPPRPKRRPRGTARALLLWPLAIFVIVAAAVCLRAAQRRSLQAAIGADRPTRAQYRAAAAAKGSSEARAPSAASPAPTW